MTYLNLSEEDLISKGALHTAKEIAGQPEVWKSSYEKLFLEMNVVKKFWEKAKQEAQKIILTGAGTSAYIGYSLEGAFQRHTKITTTSVATTHLVTHPEDYLQKEIPTILVSFARSGNSPESVAAVKLADKICNVCHHLVITCDEEGDLSKYVSNKEKLNFILPQESNDKSLAMTSSYTSMLLIGLLVARINELTDLSDEVNKIVSYGKNIINNHTSKIAEIAKLKFNRAVFLGSGPMYGTATESHLKLQELTDGKVICKNDSFLGFRHGPKAVVDEKTLVMFIFSNNEDVLKYERDLVRAMQNGKKAMLLLGISESSLSDMELDEEIVMASNETSIEEEFLPICSVVPAQILGFFKSLEVGLKPDTPSESGAISRVVQGVVIYDKVD